MFQYLSNCAWKGSAVSEGGADDDDKMLRPGAHGLRGERVTAASEVSMRKVKLSCR